MKIIFLDIDGVLNVIPKDFDKFGAIFQQPFVDNFKRIIDETDAKIVISSIWRASGCASIKEMWKVRSLPGDVIGITTLVGGYDNRGAEIKEWLEDQRNYNETIDSYVIIDDDTDMLYNQRHNFVRTSENYHHVDHVEGYGLTKECAWQAIKILNNKKIDWEWDDSKAIDFVNFYLGVKKLDINRYGFENDSILDQFKKDYYS